MRVGIHCSATLLRCLPTIPLRRMHTRERLVCIAFSVTFCPIYCIAFSVIFSEIDCATTEATRRPAENARHAGGLSLTELSCLSRWAGCDLR